jgi:histidine triad (HIT) family protein
MWAKRPLEGSMNCLFCRIASGAESAAKVFEDENFIAFLDHRPLFPGHCLLIPRAHYETLIELPAADAGPFLADAQLLCRAQEQALGAEGTFVAINNRISQSVPHLHVHVVPRRKKDGLRGFFWPRGKYRDDSELEQIRASLSAAITDLKMPRKV